MHIIQTEWRDKGGIYRKLAPPLFYCRRRRVDSEIVRIVTVAYARESGGN